MTKADKQLWMRGLNESIRKHMASAGVDRHELGRRGFALATFDRMRRCEHLPSTSTLIDLAMLLEVSPADLLRWADVERRAIARREGR